MVHDEMVTVPPLTATPPPCKQRAKREFPIGAMGTFEDERAHRQLCWSKSGSSRLTLCHPRHGHHRPAKNEQNVSFPSGHWGTLGLCRTYVTVPALRKRESGRARQPLSHRGDENFARSLRHSPPVVDHKRSQLCKRESGKACQQLSHRGIGKFSRSLRHVTYCS